MDELWLKMFGIAKKYFEVNGNLNVPSDYVTSDGFLLGKWILRQRNIYKKMLNSNEVKGDFLSDEQIDMLNSIHFVWMFEKGDWNQFYLVAKSFYVKYGHLCVSKNYIFSGFKLGLWLNVQRNAYKNIGRTKSKWIDGVSPLLPEQVKLLEDIGMVWNTKTNFWFQNYFCAKDYFFKNGNLNVPQSYISSDGLYLGKWICQQRFLYNKMLDGDSCFTSLQVKLLEDIGMVWSLKRNDWYSKYLIAKEYFLEYDHLNVPRGFITSDGFKLGNWVKIQKEAYKNRFIPKSSWTHNLSPLTDEQVKLLEDIGMVWNPREKEWLDAFSCAEGYFKGFGNLDVPSGYIVLNGFYLGSWIVSQRKAYGESLLKDWQVDMLNSIGMMWDKRKDKWMIGFSFAKEYFLEHGNLLPSKDYVTSTGFKLGHWVLCQRYAYSNIGLPKSERKYSFLPLNSEQVSLLESIGMVWNVRERIFYTTPFNLKKKAKLEKMFLEYLDEYEKDNKCSFDSYSDVLNLTNGFVKSLGK